jgi:hypothetical protein
MVTAIGVCIFFASPCLICRHDFFYYLFSLTLKFGFLFDENKMSKSEATTTVEDDPFEIRKDPTEFCGFGMFEGNSNSFDGDSV